MRDIREFREHILTLQAQIRSNDLHYRLAEIHDRLGDVPPPDSGRNRRRNRRKDAKRVPVARPVRIDRRHPRG
jgi:hypothetical protein